MLIGDYLITTIKTRRQEPGARNRRSQSTNNHQAIRRREQMNKEQKKIIDKNKNYTTLFLGVVLGLSLTLVVIGIVGFVTNTLEQLPDAPIVVIGSAAICSFIAYEILQSRKQEQIAIKE
jgi:hypothetical protein